MTMLSCYGLLVIFIVASTRTTYAYDCQVGCYLDSVTDVTVCGEDGNVYPNECFAICQNVAIVKTGSCNDDVPIGSRVSSSPSTSPTNFIKVVPTGLLVPIETMQQYEGYKMINQYSDNEIQGNVKMPMITDEMINEILQKQQESSFVAKQSATITTKTLTPLMLNSEGYEYIGTPTESFIVNQDVTSLRFVPGYDPSAANNKTRVRNLVVFGTDGRSEIKNTKTFPYSAVGAVGYSPDNIICSGTVINQSAVITAAHCVYDTDTQQWAKVTYFAPGRGYNGVDASDPYGRWPVDTVTISNEYVTSGGSFDYDFAVVTLQPNSLGQYIGDVVGYAGIEEVSGFSDPNLDLSTITGYPGDKGGRTMWTMGLCPSGFVSGASYGFDTDFIALHNCDTTPGTSGSAFMRLNGVINNDYNVRGVNVFGTTNPSQFPWNGGNIFKQGNGLYDAVYAWSGRSGSPPGSSPTPAPTDIASCFSSQTIVEVQGIGEIPITQLQIGDYVKSGGSNDYTRVYSFGHKSDHEKVTYIQIYFDDDKNSPLEISAKHYLYVNNNQFPIMASEVKIGDTLTGRRVLAKQNVTRQGFYAPLTDSGTINVNHVVASNYVHISKNNLVWKLLSSYYHEHDVGHIMWYPHRLFCRYFMRVCQKETYNQYGYSWYTSWMTYLGDMVNPLRGISSILLQLCRIPFIVLVHIIESITTTMMFWPTYIFLIALGGGIIIKKLHRLSQ